MEKTTPQIEWEKVESLPSEYNSSERFRPYFDVLKENLHAAEIIRFVLYDIVFARKLQSNITMGGAKYCGLRSGNNFKTRLKRENDNIYIYVWIGERKTIRRIKRIMS